jgi:hypothetical protein
MPKMMEQAMSIIAVVLLLFCAEQLSMILNTVLGGALPASSALYPSPLYPTLPAQATGYVRAQVVPPHGAERVPSLVPVPLVKEVDGGPLRRCVSHHEVVEQHVACEIVDAGTSEAEVGYRNTLSAGGVGGGTANWITEVFTLHHEIREASVAALAFTEKKSRHGGVDIVTEIHQAWVLADILRTPRGRGRAYQ